MGEYTCGVWNSETNSSFGKWEYYVEWHVQTRQKLAVMVDQINQESDIRHFLCTDNLTGSQ